MALIDDVRMLVAGGAKEHEIKQALREILDEQQAAEHESGLPDIPELGPGKWAALKAKLQSPGGPTNLHQMLTMLHKALDDDDQAATWRALFGLAKAAWSQHPGLRQDLRVKRQQGHNGP